MYYNFYTIRSIEVSVFLLPWLSTFLINKAWWLFNYFCRLACKDESNTSGCLWMSLDAAVKNAQELGHIV